MDTNRIVYIILSDLSLENLKLQEKLEFEINSVSEVDSKILKIKDLLRSIALNELSLTKFQSLVSEPNNNNKNLNQEEDGKIY